MLRNLTVTQRRLAVIGGVVLLVILWALFRPELLFTKKNVDEPLPGANSSNLSIRHVASTGKNFLISTV